MKIKENGELPFDKEGLINNFIEWSDGTSFLPNVGCVEEYKGDKLPQMSKILFEGPFFWRAESYFKQ
jgi:hypothetical protein